MPDTHDIAPALTAEEWERVRTVQSWREDGAVWFTGDEGCVADIPRDEIPGAIAHLNYALPDDDPRKVTRESVDRVRRLLDNMSLSATWREGRDEDLAFSDRFFAALYALLPPDGR